MITKTWSKEFALNQQKLKDDHLDVCNLKYKAQLLEMEKHVQERLGKSPIEVAFDVGGGSRGGALFFFKKAKRSVLVDILADEFVDMGKLPDHVTPVVADFEKIPQSSGSVDVVFAWDVFDHARDKSHFSRGVKEAERILKLGGLLFMTLPLRYEPREGHTVCLNIRDAREALTHFGVLREIAVGHPTYYDFVYFFVGQKLVNKMNGFMIWTTEWSSGLERKGLFYTGKGSIVDLSSWSPFAWECKRYESDEEAGKIACLLRKKEIRFTNACHVISMNKIREYWS